MTALAPAPGPPHAPPRVPTRPHRAHRPTTPATLPRPGPRRSWDPLAVDAEGAPPGEEGGLPPTQALAPLPPEEIATVASVLTKAVVEVLLGLRPPGQVQSWLLADVWETVRRRAALTRRTQVAVPHGQVRILRVHPCQLSDRVCELSIVLHDGARVRAAALRLALHRGRWRAAVIRIG